MFIETARKGKISKSANLKVYSEESEGIASQSSVIVQVFIWWRVRACPTPYKRL